MNELELKYGCNPNQKPSRIYMKDGSDLPIKVLMGRKVQWQVSSVLWGRRRHLCLETGGLQRQICRPWSCGS